MTLIPCPKAIFGRVDVSIPCIVIKMYGGGLLEGMWSRVFYKNETVGAFYLGGLK